MPIMKIANILYNMCLDMDYADGAEFYEEDIKLLAAEFEKLDTPGRDTLEMIAWQNEDMFDAFADRCREAAED